MNKSIYVFRDRLSGEYEYFGLFVNDAVASREFKRACAAENVPVDDLELYCTSELDTKTGRIRAVTDSGDPLFIERGKRDVQN